MIDSSGLCTRGAAVALTVVGIAVASGCTGAGDAEVEVVDPPPELEAFDPGSFPPSARIDNPWMPLEPGTRFVYEGTTVEDDGSEVPHRIVVNVTDLTKDIGGVRALVTWDLDYGDGELVEAELAFLAQDTLGTVWRMGEYPEEYEDGEFVEAAPWIHGLAGARAGIMMPADPRPGTPSYAQGWGPAVEWDDRGRVDGRGERTCVAAGCWDDVLVISETSASEPGAEQLKYYASGAGNVRVGWRGDDPTRETLELVSVERLDPAALAEVRAGARELEESAYRRSEDVYGRTPPLEARTP